jgi:hypothetical protein
MLSNPAFAERKKDIIDCRTGAYQNAVTLDIHDGERETVSTQPNRLALISRQLGGVLVEFRNLSYDTLTPVYVGSKDQMKTGEAGIYVPDTVIVQDFNKVHEITVNGRNADNTGSVVEVKGVCPKNAPRK